MESDFVDLGNGSQFDFVFSPAAVEHEADPPRLPLFTLVPYSNRVDFSLKLGFFKVSCG